MSGTRLSNSLPIRENRSLCQVQGNQMTDRVNVAETVILAAFKILIPDLATRVEGLADLADVLIGQHRNKRARKTLLHRLEESTDLLADRLSQFELAEFPNLLLRDRQLAIESVCTAVATVNIDVTDVIKSNLNPRYIANQLRPATESELRLRLLPEPAEEYGYHYLTMVSGYIAAIVR